MSQVLSLRDTFHVELDTFQLKQRLTTEHSGRLAPVAVVRSPGRAVTLEQSRLVPETLHVVQLDVCEAETLAVIAQKRLHKSEGLVQVWCQLKTSFHNEQRAKPWVGLPK